MATSETPTKKTSPKEIITHDLNNFNIKKIARPDHEITMVQFPVDDKPTELVKMLGGNHRITQVNFDSKQLATAFYIAKKKNHSEIIVNSAATNNAYFPNLKFRPSDPFCHSTNGQVLRTAGIVVEFERKKRPREESESTESSKKSKSEGPWTVRVKGTVKKNIEFPHLDFQYIPQSIPVTSTEETDEVDEIVLSKVLSQSGVPMQLPPAKFATQEPFTYTFEQKEMSEAQKAKNKRPSAGIELIDLDWKTYKDPKTPLDPRAMEPASESISIGSVEKGKKVSKTLETRDLIHVRLEELFKEREMWLATDLVQRFGKIKSLHDAHLSWLRLYCYKWSSGPWIKNWTLKGFDPRKAEQKDAALKFQTIDIRLNTVAPKHYVKAIGTPKKATTLNQDVATKGKAESKNVAKEQKLQAQQQKQLIDLMQYEDVARIIQKDSLPIYKLHEESGWMTPETKKSIIAAAKIGLTSVQSVPQTPLTSTPSHFPTEEETEHQEEEPQEDPEETPELEN